MAILGLNAYHPDSSAAIIENGELIAAAEEERFNRLKHWSGFPEKSIKYCLDAAGVSMKQVERIVINRNTNANIFKKSIYVLTHGPSLVQVRQRFINKRKIENIAEILSSKFVIDKKEISKKIIFVEHHRAHVASSYLVSPFEDAALLSVDGFGDFSSCLFAEGDGSKIKVLDNIFYPHSLGVFYTAITQFLGFLRYGDEYKVMGLAPYGEPRYLDKMQRLIQLEPGGKFSLNLKFFQHHTKGDQMSWQNCTPEMGILFSKQLEGLFGNPRLNEDITQRHKDIAASVQAVYEQTLFYMLNCLYQRTGKKFLCLSGGCAMNSVANGKIFEKTPFENLYVQPAAGDGGGAIGAAYYFWNVILGKKRNFKMAHAYWGPQFSDDIISGVIQKNQEIINQEKCSITIAASDNELCKKTAELLADGSVVGWFQGRMEWGPRALGNRSILCDPRRRDAKKILNEKIKMRESFRPFAPSILRESVKDWFETDCDVPFMLQVFSVKKSMRSMIPAVTHVNGSGRLQTVSIDSNKLYYKLIKAFNEKTGIPILLNTSFNENEPIVCTPQEALDCFLRTRMDVLVLGPYMIKRTLHGN